MTSVITKSLLTVMTMASMTAFGASKLESGKYNIDPMHSKVGFEIPHLMISSVDGKFNTFSGVITIDSNFTKSSLQADADIASIDTGVTKRDDHLKSADFFDAAKYPKMTFKSTSITGNAESFKAVGDLTIKGTTKKVTFDGKYTGSAVDGYGNTKAAFAATTKISRKDFGLTYNQMVEAGPVVGNEVTISLKIQGALEKAPVKK
ncbi:MAG: YceI family protein [Bdellovibrio sp.]|nr:YceI family protein [Bdellovibrio sp.]